MLSCHAAWPRAGHRVSAEGVLSMGEWPRQSGCSAWCLTGLPAAKEPWEEEDQAFEVAGQGTHTRVSQDNIGPTHSGCVHLPPQVKFLEYEPGPTLNMDCGYCLRVIPGRVHIPPPGPGPGLETSPQQDGLGWPNGRSHQLSLSQSLGGSLRPLGQMRQCQGSPLQGLCLPAHSMVPTPTGPLGTPPAAAPSSRVKSLQLLLLALCM